MGGGEGVLSGSVGGGREGILSGSVGGGREGVLMGDMSRIDLVNKNLLANVFRNCRKRNK